MILFITSGTSAILLIIIDSVRRQDMRATYSALFLLILCCATLQAQDNVPAALEKRLLTFTDQLWLSWMKAGDVRSINALRMQEILDDTPCDLVAFTSQGTCQQLSKNERRDDLQTVENILTLLSYRFLSHEDLDENKGAQ